VLQKLAHEVIEQAKRAYARWVERLPAFTRRATSGNMSSSRRVVIKVEVSAQGVNTRFVVTDMEQARTKCSTGTSPVPWQMENEIKDHKLY